jgi:hypothetical protein
MFSSDHTIMMEYDVFVVGEVINVCCEMLKCTDGLFACKEQRS